MNYGTAGLSVAGVGLFLVHGLFLKVPLYKVKGERYSFIKTLL
jgi:hypothetical protein